MPTVNPRVNVTLSPSLDLVVSRLAALQRVSKSSVLRELLEAAAPALTRAVALMEAAEKAKPDIISGLARSLERSQTAAEVALESALHALDHSEDLVSQAEAVRGRRPGSGGGGAAHGDGAAKSPSTPVPVTRGSGTPVAQKKGVRRGRV
jgi:hypothetical protein